MDELKYHPNANARALSHQGNETLGIVVADVSSPFFGIMVKAVDQVAYDTGNFCWSVMVIMMPNGNVKPSNNCYVTNVPALWCMR